jgi:hypothetical protein
MSKVFDPDLMKDNGIKEEARWIRLKVEDEPDRWGPRDREDARIRRQGQDGHFPSIFHAGAVS